MGKLTESQARSRNTPRRFRSTFRIREFSRCRRQRNRLGAHNRFPPYIPGHTLGRIPYGSISSAGFVGVFRLRAHPSRGYRFSPGAPLNMTVRRRFIRYLKNRHKMISASQYPAVRDTLCFFLPTGINSFLFPHLFSTNFHRELRFSTVIPQLNFPGSCARSFAQAQSYQQRVWRSGALDCSWRSFRVAKPAESWNPG